MRESFYPRSRRQPQHEFSVTYGQIRLDPEERRWVITTAPHVAMRLRNNFAACKTARGSDIKIDDTPANSRELEWFLERYPHDMDERHRRVLTLSAAGHREREENARAIIAGEIKLAPIDLALPLRQYQRVAFDLVQTLGGLLVADEVGIGKTAVGIAAAVANSPALIVCETHLQQQWKDEIKLFAPKARVRIAPRGRPEDLGPWDILIVPYTKINGWRDHLARTVVCVVLDEIQQLRDMTTGKYSGTSHILEGARVKVGLSATPIFNLGGEIFAILDLLRPGELGSLDEFHREWCTPAGNGKYVVNDPVALNSYLLSASLMIRRTRKDVGRELPPLVRVQHKCPFKQDLLDAIQDDALQLARRMFDPEVEFVEKGQAAREFDSKLRQTTGIAKAPYVAGLAAEMASTGQKIIVAAWHRGVYEILLATFKANNVPAFMYTGSESPTQKAKNAKDFIEHEGGAVLIMSLRSGAGLNGLQNVSNTIIYAELDWSPKAHHQLNGRLVRDGQKDSVSAVYCTIDAGSDPIVAGILGLKDEQQNGIIDGVAMTDEETVLGAEELTSRIKTLAADYIQRHTKGHGKELDLQS